MKTNAILSRTRSRRRQCVIAMAAFLLPLFARTSVRAQEESTDLDTPGLVIEATLGWDGHVERSAPVPVSFLIKNFSERPIEGRIVLQDLQRAGRADLGEVFIGAGATRRFTSIQSMSGWFSCSATLQNENKIFWRRDLQFATRGLSDAAFVLFVDQNGRKLPLVNPVPGAGVSEQDYSYGVQIAKAAGREVECLAVSPWQMPNHCGPLVIAQSIVFAEDAGIKSLGTAQWQAIMTWVTQGGHLFVHEKSNEIIDRLNSLAPFAFDPPIAKDEFSIRRIGLGAVCEYRSSLFGADEKQQQENLRLSKSLRDEIAAFSAVLPSHRINGVIDRARIYESDIGRQQKNSVLVAAFFGLYTLFSGATLLFFRRSRRWVTIYTVAVVGVACVCSTLVGGVLRFSRGDASWVTVTHAGAGGAVQAGKVEVRSAGARNTKLAVAGLNPDLQQVSEIEHRNYYYYNSGLNPEYSRFTWQPNRAKGIDGALNAYQIFVSMTPWSSRNLFATDNVPEMGAIDFKLSFKPDNANVINNTRETMIASGQYHLQLKNTLDVNLFTVWVIICCGVEDKNGNGGEYYATVSLQDVLAGETRSNPIEVTMDQDRWGNNTRRNWKRGSLTVPTVSKIGETNAWLVAKLKQSPGLSIRKDLSDFDLNEELHLFVQEIRPEDLSVDGLLIPPAAQAANETDSTEDSADQ